MTLTSTPRRVHVGGRVPRVVAAADARGAAVRDDLRGGRPGKLWVVKPLSCHSACFDILGESHLELIKYTGAHGDNLTAHG